MRVADLEDEISVLVGKRRRILVGILVVLVILVGLAIGALGGAAEWVWPLLGGLLFLPWFLRAIGAEMLRITERKEGLLLQLEEVKQPGQLHTPDDAGSRLGPKTAQRLHPKLPGADTSCPIPACPSGWFGC